MKFRTGYEQKEARVEMLPLIDVVFLLLVFFIYAMLSMVLHHGLNVDLPTASEASVDPRDYLSITLTEEGRIFIGETETTLDGLPQVVASRLHDSGTNTPLYVEGDQKADLGLALGILNELRRAGIEKVSFSCAKD